MKIAPITFAMLGSLMVLAMTVGASSLGSDTSGFGNLANARDAQLSHTTMPKYQPSTIASVGIGGSSAISGPLIAVAPFDYDGGSANEARAAECLAAAAWYEAGDDSIGQKAVIQTVINRVRSRDFPNSVCGVVFEGSQLDSGCQFTFTCDGSLNRRHPSLKARNRALLLAKRALNGFVDASVGNATHYHANYVTPWWSHKLERLASVGPHIFYRWPGNGNAGQGQVKLVAEAAYRDLVAMAKDGKPPQERNSAAHAPNLLTTNSTEAALGHAQIGPLPDPNVFYIPVTATEAAGRWAIVAMRNCADRQSCQVVGYTDSDTAVRNQLRGASEKDRPLFLFIRDRTSGMDIALWDCERVKRLDATQCLPAGQNALTKLMQHRS